MTVETRVRLSHAVDLRADLVDEHRLLEGVHRLVRHPVLSRTQQLTHPTYPHVFFCELESIPYPGHEFQPLHALLGRIVGQQQAMALSRATSYASSELMQLRKAEAVGAFHHHHSCVGDVDPHLDHGCRNQDLDVAGGADLHHVVLSLEASVDESQLQVWKHVPTQTRELGAR